MEIKLLEPAMYSSISACRICGNEHLETVLELGEQTLTGVFPKSTSDKLTVGPLTLVKCTGPDCCGLLQLRHSYTLSEMYGDNYGYRSGLNPSMVAHLKSKVERIEALAKPGAGDVILDIGSNDGTTLAQYNCEGCKLVGMDPTAEKFSKYYKDSTILIADFFSAARFKKSLGEHKAKVVTSFSMFYDLEDPTGFMREVSEVLRDDGIWVLEQSYMPLMLKTNSYDTVCHEHLEYYALAQISWMCERCGLEIIDVELNDVNGGSFSIVVQKAGGPLPMQDSVARLREVEAKDQLNDLATYDAFRQRVEKLSREFIEFLQAARADNKTVVALGASTKGNVILQYCKIDETLLSMIGEVNADKFGAFTPGTNIPILDEKTVLQQKPDYVVVLPWHFRAFFEAQERYQQLNLVYPLPVLDVRSDAQK